MKKRRAKTIYDIAAIPLTPVASEGRPSLKKFTAEYNKAEEAKRQEELSRGYREAQEQLRAESREVTRRVKNFYSLPLSEMASYPVEAAPIDYGDFQTRTGLRDTHKEWVVYQQFRTELSARGTILNESGWQRLGSWVFSVGQSAEVTTQVWEEGLHRLASLSCFHEGEVSNYQSRPKPVQPAAQPVTQPEPGIDELLRTTSAESRSGREILVEAVKKEVRAGVTSAFYKFAEECKKFGNLTNDEKEALARIMDARNLNATSIRDWHEARRLAVGAGYLRQIFLTADELLAQDLEQGLVKTDTFEQKREFARRVAEANGGKVPLLG